ncbi:hypothetical protein GCM10022198_02330 [Klugiella xanthotipulae]|uniref:XPB/Ssl2-like helicase family protein n=1 Tax=Klugiella xanthotipulae TaxID=244735 RepID=A0A543I4Z8_9MICO|nr:helicase-associated domain-containing protein [Klugiella xanthotipulae]TQM65631.1 XPB/Ssl2-like helicase family protein [Klugiella xanthotipulae]
MTSVLSLSSQLSGATTTSLEITLTERQVTAAGIKDFFDLATALMRPESLTLALGQLERSALAILSTLATETNAGQWMTIDEIVAALSAANPDSKITPELISTHRDRLATLALIRVENEAIMGWPEVDSILEMWPTHGLPGHRQLTQLVPPTLMDALPHTELETVDRHAAERAFALVQAVAELIAELSVQPAAVRARGGLTLPTTKRLAEALRVDIDWVPFALDLAGQTNLAQPSADGWKPTPDAREWLATPAPERWAFLAQRWYSRTPPDITQALAQHPRHVWGDTVRTLMPWLYPGGRKSTAEWIETVLREARFMGIFTNDSASSFAYALTTEGPAAAAAALAPLFPAEVSTVYIQPDLTVISPGPLLATLDTRMRRLALVENRALAATYRITETTLLRALNAGDSVEDIRTFLTEISLTGIPQPLDYLLTETVRRHGSIRVEELTPTGGIGDSLARSRITATDHHALATLLVDRNLQHLSLSRSASDALTSPIRTSVVLASLQEARYPAAPAEAANRGASSAPVTHEAPHTPHTEASAQEAPDHDPDAAPLSPVQLLIAKLRKNQSEQGAETVEAGFNRQLSLAVKAKSTIRVSLVAPNGATHEYTILPTSVSAARLRGLDHVSDVERTLPIGWITAVETIEG